MQCRKSTARWPDSISSSKLLVRGKASEAHKRLHPALAMAARRDRRPMSSNAFAAGSNGPALRAPLSADRGERAGELNVRLASGSRQATRPRPDGEQRHPERDGRTGGASVERAPSRRQATAATASPRPAGDTRHGQRLAPSPRHRHRITPRIGGERHHLIASASPLLSHHVEHVGQHHRRTGSAVNAPFTVCEDHLSRPFWGVREGAVTASSRWRLPCLASTAGSEPGAGTGSGSHSHRSIARQTDEH